jgi:hypothetical protein
VFSLRVEDVDPIQEPFMSHDICEYAESLKIKLLSSSPYYTQANGQAESSNRTLIKLIKKKIEEHHKRWHEILSEALWAHHISKHSYNTLATPGLAVVTTGSSLELLTSPTDQP